MADFFSSQFLDGKRFWQRRRVARGFDLLFDARIAGRMRAVRREAARLPALDVLVASVAVPSREAGRQRVLAQFAQSHHRVTTCDAPMGDRGKFDNINAALEQYGPLHCDWLILTDDDVVLPPDFLDVFLFLATRLDLKIAQPAHRCMSWTALPFNYRRWNSLARRTRFVESGPITAFHKDALPLVLPFPKLRWAWGTDIAWSVAADRAGMAIGIVDATPIEHLRMVASGYDKEAAMTEARAFLAAQGIDAGREQLFVNTQILSAI